MVQKEHTVVITFMFEMEIGEFEAENICLVTTILKRNLVGDFITL